MNLALSNLAWDAAQNDEIYREMNRLSIRGLEIAPTKLFGDSPYDDPGAVRDYAAYLGGFSLRIVSMQSIWYRRTEMLFADGEQRNRLLEYSKKAVLFAEAAGCGNLVFGSPKNRVIGNLKGQHDVAAGFFDSIGRFAEEHGVVFAIEANPAVYGTDFLNTTRQALDFAREVGRPGIMVNLDVGTLICNREPLVFSKEDVALIHHVHISEPYLQPIIRRPEHALLRSLLEENGYKGFLSVEMGNSSAGEEIFKAARYLKEVFG